MATGSKQPAIGSHTLNGRALLTFDGVDDELDTDFSSSLAQPYTVYAVVKLLTTTPVEAYFLGFDALFGYAQTGGQKKWHFAAGGGGGFSPGNVDTAAAHYFTYIVNGGASSFYMDGALQAVSVTAGSLPMDFTSLGMGASYPASWDVGTILVYPSAHGSTDQASTESYLNSRWFVPTAPALTFLAQRRVRHYRR